ncbi:MAG: putative sulfate/molybdate transporter [Desulfobulbaceae bacterium]|nr:putative sulfate/molybdate transporter [Desulfobulbaceae bacterium]
MTKLYSFNRLELAGSLGDMGTLLPIAAAMVVVNGLDPLGVFLAVGLFYVVSGVYFGVTVPVQPMKVIGAYAVATGLTASQISASTLMMGVLLLVLGACGAMDFIRKYTPIAVIRGVQLSTGILLISGGMKFIIGVSGFQILQGAAEPHLSMQTLGPIPIGLVLGGIAGFLTLILLDNKKYPAGLMVVLFGILIGVIGTTKSNFGLHLPSFHMPRFFPASLPATVDFNFALLVLVLPQLPMTVGNAVLAYTDLSSEYFGERSARVTNRRVCLSMAVANLMSFCLGGMPLCHGAGGLAAHYRFGARTAGSNLMIGGLFISLALLLGPEIIYLLNLLPMAVLGVLLVFAGLQLALTIMSLTERQEYFVAMLMLGITLAANLASAFVIGWLIAHLFRWKKILV